ncbi:Tetratricopeptide-like helical domain [Trinorchestia longiramus]|nr:Tetratricopeptide-like helical domain [Trinorchestia longiramus]
MFVSFQLDLDGGGEADRSAGCSGGGGSGGGGGGSGLVVHGGQSGCGSGSNNASNAASGGCTSSAGPSGGGSSGGGSKSGGGNALSGTSKALFLEKVHQSTAACQAGDFDTAVALYTEAIALEPQNHILYSNRSAAHIKLQQFQKALQDATKARDLNPKWPKVSTSSSLTYIDFARSLNYVAPE